MKLITESCFDIELYEDKSNKNLYVVGLFSSAEVENANKRKYRQSVLQREISNYIEEKVKNKTALGQLNHPASPETDLEKAAILIESLEWKGHDVYGKAKILSTPAGLTAKALIADGVKLGISSRGLGTVNEDGYVNEDYRLLTYDLVSAPSQPGAWMNGIYEAKEFTIVEAPDSQDVEKMRREYFMKVKQFLSEMDQHTDPPKSGPAPGDVMKAWNDVMKTVTDPAAKKAMEYLKGVLAKALK